MYTLTPLSNIVLYDLSLPGLTILGDGEEEAIQKDHNVLYDLSLPSISILGGGEEEAGAAGQVHAGYPG